jgi:hypothetical protein
VKGAPLDFVGGDTVVYYIQVSTDTTFATAVIQDSVSSDTTYQPNPLAFSTQYYWRVRATKAVAESPWSTVWRFTTKNPPVPAISVSADTIDFGDVPVSDTSSASITISNLGAATLTVSALTTTNSVFSVLSPSTPFDLAPLTGTQLVTLRFIPQTATTTTGSLHITSNDPDDTLVTVVLTGKGTAAPPPPVIRVNSGGGDFTDSGGNLFAADRAYVAGGFGYTGGLSKTVTGSIAGTTDDPLYQALRTGLSFTYTFDGLPPNNYNVTLHFQEPTLTVPNQRVFDVSAEGVVRLNDFDIFASAAARLTAHLQTFTVNVTDGQLNLSFVKVSGSASPLVCAIAVVPALAKAGDATVEAVQLPLQFQLHQNYPNPFNPATTIHYTLKEEGLISLRIYNLLGEEVITLVNEVQTKGYKTVVWNGANSSGDQVSSGIYLCRINAGDLVETRKMVYLK